MIRLIDANALTATLGITDMDCGKCAWYSKSTRRCKRGGDFEDACCTIENAPTIESEQPKIIQCKECIYLQSDEIFGAYWCSGRSVKPDHYCGYAVRRQDDEMGS